MKKLLFGMVLSLMVVFLLGGALLVFADDGENFEKAGQQALEEKEEVLIEEKTRLERIVQVLAADRVVITDEMIALRNEVEYFNQLKERYDKELELYEKKTSTVLKAEYEKAINAYFVGHTLFKRDTGDEEVRRFFASETGQDVVVKKGAVIDGFCISLMVIKAVLLVFMVFFIRFKDYGLGAVAGLALVGFLLWLLLA